MLCAKLRPSDLHFINYYWLTIVSVTFSSFFSLWWSNSSSKILIISSLDPNIPIPPPQEFAPSFRTRNGDYRQASVTGRGKDERTQRKTKPEKQAKPAQAEPICFPCPILRQSTVAKIARSGARLLGSEPWPCHYGLITLPLGLGCLTNTMRKIMKLMWLSDSLGNRFWDKNWCSEFSWEKHQKGREGRQSEKTVKRNRNTVAAEPQLLLQRALRLEWPWQTYPESRQVNRTFVPLNGPIARCRLLLDGGYSWMGM